MFFHVSHASLMKADLETMVLELIAKLNFLNHEYPVITLCRTTMKYFSPTVVRLKVVIRYL